MQSGDSELPKALASGDRFPTHTTRLGGFNIGEVVSEETSRGSRLQSWSVERSYNTDLPGAMRAFAGSASAQLELEISGTDALPAPQLYSPWAPRVTGDLVRPGQTVVHSAGINGHDLPAFRGTVRSRTATSGSGTVKVSVLDGAERLRGPAQFNNPYTGFSTGNPIASEVWCVDELLRQGGVHSCPPPRAPEADTVGPDGAGDYDAFTILYASLHGGVNSTYGQPESVPNPADYSYVHEEAPHTMALVPKARGLSMAWMPRSRVLTPSADVWLAEAHMNSAIGPGNTVEIKLLLDRLGTGTGRISLNVDFAAGRVTIYSGTGADMDSGPAWGFKWSWPKLAALKGAWHIGMLVTPSGTSGGTLPTVQPLLVAPDGTRMLGGIGTYVDPSANQPAAELNTIQLTTDIAVEALQVTTRVSPFFTLNDFAEHGKRAKAVELGDPVLPLRTIPKVSGSQWDVISEMARASISTAEFDERGVFRWRSFRRFQQRPVAADLIVTSRREIAALTVSEEIDACRNYCEQPYLDWRKRLFDLTGEFTPAGVIEIPAGQSKEVSYPIPDEGFEVGPPTPYDDAAPLSGGSRVRFGDAWVKDVSGGTAVKGAVLVSVRRVATEMVLRFTNRGTKTLYTTTKDGKPSIVVAPLKVFEAPAQPSKAKWDTESQKYYGLQQYVAQSGEWVQSAAVAGQLADVLLQAGKFPVPVLSDVEVLYDPRIQLGDVVRVVDTTGAALDTLTWVIGIRTTAGAGGDVQQSLTLRGYEPNGVPLGYWLSTDPPTDPDCSRSRTYAEVTAGHSTLEELATITYRALKEYV
ncbi:hypothetical protein [Streptomyces sp. H27-D2]|uniref:hypothetical protein n=1 Tax=Streptomyces sp. H27-D2 TaxID=3046304 RepID=UPI002DBFF23E|nr:hypothetical protein [Streptomyces sp. H27-D2]MEC4016400.1 hypothetical protein [Streptomyces sp. H27-D2]